MTETWKEHMQRMQDTYGHLPNHISNMADKSLCERCGKYNATMLLGKGIKVCSLCHNPPEDVVKYL